MSRICARNDFEAGYWEKKKKKKALLLVVVVEEITKKEERLADYSRIRQLKEGTEKGLV